MWWKPTRKFDTSESEDSDVSIGSDSELDFEEYENWG